MKPDHDKTKCFIVKRRSMAIGNGSNNTVRTGVAGATADTVFNSVSKNSEFYGTYLDWRQWTFISLLPQ
jgi:hypothetical protein